MRIILPFPPSANRYWRVFRGHAVKSKEAKAYQEAVKLACIQADIVPLVGDVALVLRVVRPHAARDLDNCAKVALDAIQGHVYANDKQVAFLELRRDYDPDGDGWIELEALTCTALDEGKIKSRRKKKPA